MRFSSPRPTTYWQATAEEVAQQFDAVAEPTANSLVNEIKTSDLPLFAHAESSVLLATLIEQLLVAERSGNTALPLSDFPGIAAEQIAVADIPGVAAWQTPSQTTLPTHPVIAYDDKLALHRHLTAEWQITQAVCKRMQVSGTPTMTLDAAPDALSDEQRSAVVAASQQRLTLISGGPGTGKTTIVATLLQHCITHGLSADQIAICAPTGKAVQRLQESLANADLSIDGLTFATLHRLLGLFPADFSIRQTPRYDHLPYRLLIVDEASMLDVRLLQTLFKRVQSSAQIVLLGDHNQLGPIGLGQPFADIYRALSATPAVQHLSTSYRFTPDSLIGQLAQLALNADNAQSLLMALASAQAMHTTEALPTLLESRFAAYRDMTRQASVSPMALLAESRRLKVLTSHHLGTIGCDAINQAVDTWLRPPSNSMSGFYHGQVLMMTHNDPVNALYNGDMGICWVRDGLPYFVTDSLESSAVGFREIPLLELSGLVSAYAITIHKSQGSEYERVIITLSEHNSNDEQVVTLMNRALLYTAITRAKQSVEVVATNVAINQCLGEVSRQTLLESLLRSSTVAPLCKDIDL